MKSKKTNVNKASADKIEEGYPDSRAHFHIRWGWWSLLVFLTLGIVLEVLHAFRVQSYLAAGDAEWRRLMWTLSHTHGVLIALVNIVFGVCLCLVPMWRHRTSGLASYALLSASILMPGGFFLGGLFVYPSDPGIGVWLVPVGSLLLFVAVLIIAISITRSPIKMKK